MGHYLQLSELLLVYLLYVSQPKLQKQGQSELFYGFLLVSRGFSQLYTYLSISSNVLLSLSTGNSLKDKMCVVHVQIQSECQLRQSATASSRLFAIVFLECYQFGRSGEDNLGL